MLGSRWHFLRRDRSGDFRREAGELSRVRHLQDSEAGGRQRFPLDAARPDLSSRSEGICLRGNEKGRSIRGRDASPLSGLLKVSTDPHHNPNMVYLRVPVSPRRHRDTEFRSSGLRGLRARPDPSHSCITCAHLIVHQAAPSQLQKGPPIAERKGRRFARPVSTAKWGGHTESDPGGERAWARRAQSPYKRSAASWKGSRRGSVVQYPRSHVHQSCR